MPCHRLGKLLLIVLLASCGAQERDVDDIQKAKSKIVSKWNTDFQLTSSAKYELETGLSNSQEINAILIEGPISNFGFLKNYEKLKTLALDLTHPLSQDEIESLQAALDNEHFRKNMVVLYSRFNPYAFTLKKLNFTNVTLVDEASSCDVLRQNGVARREITQNDLWVMRKLGVFQLDKRPFHWIPCSDPLKN